ncbi:MAG: hypothetical protein DHS20C18_50600 [Saprospiraceae bacterium]|nr:MAG: hypothetical protein DHS20C18_50600 [Saprospiraceae bacterium]
MRTTLYLLVLSLTVLACQQNQDVSNQDNTEKVDLAKTIPGVWETTYIRVAVNSYQNMDSSFVFEIKEENWVEKMQIAPLRIYFEVENKFRREHRALNGTLMSTSRGMWNTFGDTLMLIEPDATYNYEVKIKNGLGEFSSQLDWDGDGEADDEYLDIKRFIGLSTSVH